MKKIKSFIYLDNEKMYSISSQLFEGLTEYVVKSEKRSEIEKDEQKGSLGSGRLMADIIETESGHSEKKFLHHYSYNLFETELINEKKVLVITPETINDNIKELENYNFVKITNKVAFNDSKIVKDILAKFNEIGEALTYTIHNKELSNNKDKAKELIAPIKDRNQQHRAKIILNSTNTLKALAKEANLHLDPKFLESLTTILNYGYNESFEVQIPFVNENSYHLFSALLNRELLTESELSIIKKYSRETEKEFTLFGIITQAKTVKEKVSLYKDAVDKVSGSEANMKEIVMNIITSITNVETIFNGKLDYEFIIDPIAVYREI